jgi:hypothetical protein
MKNVKPQIILQWALAAMVLVPLLACAGKSVAKESASSGANEENCALSPDEREALLNLDYASFDQSLPNGGWRKFEACPRFTRDLLDAYITRHRDALEKQQWDVLVWHSGQISAEAGDSADAIAKMAQTLKPAEKPTDAFLWNPYAKATIAFLQKDRPALLAERQKMARGLSPFNRLNLHHVDAFIRCFDSTYRVAYSITDCQPSETNRERIRSLAVPFALDKPLPTEFFGLTDFFKMKKVIFVGEMHGTKATPALFAQIAAAVASPERPTLVALEIPQSSQAAIDAFLKSGDEAVLKADPFFTRADQDGRSSRAMVRLLKTLAKLPRTTVVAMDPMGASQTMTGAARDRAMAEFLNSKRAGFDHTLVLSGNVHSSFAVGTPLDPEYRPMALVFKELAKDLAPGDVFNVLVRYGKVDTWSCDSAEASSCRAHYGKEMTNDEYATAVPDPGYFVWEGEERDGHVASIFVRTSGLSKPFVSKSGPQSSAQNAAVEASATLRN